jgi:Uma2 family endonuclease
MSTVLEPDRKTNSGLPESDQLYEIVDGERVEKVMSAYASWVAHRLATRLTMFADSSAIGTGVEEMVFILDEERDLRRRPDVAFLSAQTWPVGTPPPPTGDWPVIPDLAVEVLSPSNRYEEVLRKLGEYFRYGVREVWLVAPAERIVQVFTSPEELRNVRLGESLSTPLIPGWSISIAEILPHEAAPSVSDE